MTKNRFFILIVLCFLFRAVFAFSVGLIDDEAYHWSWSKDLMLSYYDHPGMIAWLHAIGTSVFGDTIFAVRLPAFLCFLATFLIAVRLSYEMFGETAARFMALMILWSPFWGFGGYVSSPEPPFILCWMLAAWIFYQGIREDKPSWSVKKTWLLLGVVMGLGLNSKFIMSLLGLGFGLYLLMTKERRKDLLTIWPWAGALVATVICLPVFAWNYEFGWPGFKYQFHDRQKEGGFSLSRYAQFYAAQILFLTPVPYFLVITSLVRGFVERINFRWRFVFALAIPSIALFYTQALFADFKPHWSGAAYFVLMLGGSGIWALGWKNFIKPQSKKVLVGILLFFIPLNLFIYFPFAGPYLPKIYRALNPGKEWNIRWDLSNEFYGWTEVGQYVVNLRNKRQVETGQSYFLASHRYETTAQLFWGAKERVYQLNEFRSHYSIIQSYRGDWEALKGKNAILVAPEKYPLDPFEESNWDSCTSQEFKVYRADELARVFTIFECKNFQGIKGKAPVVGRAR